MSLLPDYSRQAERYDKTRSASPSLLSALRDALRGAPGRQLADIGGGTGNYAAALERDGWKPVVIDRSPDMLRRARAKGLAVVQADAQHLPLADAAFDAATMISMLHHVEDRLLALAEARRILRPGGRLVLVAFTAEDAETLWVLDYFPCSRPWMAATHPARQALRDALAGVQLTTFQLNDMADASLAALSADPRRLLQAAEGGATSYFERLRRDHPQDLKAGLERLRKDIAAGRAPSRAGTATIATWTKSEEACMPSSPAG